MGRAPVPARRLRRCPRRDTLSDFEDERDLQKTVPPQRLGRRLRVSGQLTKDGNRIRQFQDVVDDLVRLPCALPDWSARLERWSAYIARAHRFWEDRNPGLVILRDVPALRRIAIGDARTIDEALGARAPSTCWPTPAAPPGSWSPPRPPRAAATSTSRSSTTRRRRPGPGRKPGLLQRRRRLSVHSAASRRSWRRALRRSASDWMRLASAEKASRSAWISSSWVARPER
jgi:hypothetical protein